ncbi:zf-HC2 domain-containing protein [Jidongwangia harbinensis]|uniref:zf-HC2 domain-containing protein n=1 Tax=Jidongwangia harbinensis TaxID=2878561 RepID=UPI001CD9C4B1|nr:zf-HC2 domain-containing protein [Jidongwangia harbinensis]MCA2216971.1 zf-HC2 domain-containing protein [Jidongwangia harbinensis]
MTAHVPAATLTAYASGDLGADDAMAWPVEAHLENCPRCQDRLAELVTGPVQEILAVARTAVLAESRSGPRPARRRRLRRLSYRWLSPSVIPWALVTLIAVAAAFLLDEAFSARSSVVLLLAPVAPLSGLAVAWSRRWDPAWETVSGTARAGLDLLLRRTVVILLTVLPLLAVVGWRVGANPALWLLPCLTFTAAALLLGGLIGVSRAAALIGAAWMLAVALPALVMVRLPVLVQPESLRGWAVAAVALAGLVVLRAGDHRQHAGRN